MNAKLFLSVILLSILLILACSKYRGLSINGVKITEDTTWNDIIDDSEERRIQEEIRRTFESLLLDSRFDELDEWAEKYRTSQEKFTNGEWALNTFYSGLTHYQVFVPEASENWEIRLAKIREWVEKKPDSVTARVALSECLVGYAFYQRGYGYADSVTEDRWRLFKNRLREAQTALYESKHMRDKCPQWRAAILRFSGQGWNREKYQQVFKDAIKYNPQFTMYYFRMAIQLMPRWGGYRGELEEFCKEAADFIGGKDGDILYAQIIWFLDKNYGLDNLGKLNPRIDWFRVKRGVEALTS